MSMMNAPVDELRKNTWNTNQVSVEHEERIRKSIERNGLFKPIIVRQVPDVAGYEIIGGEHRWEQAIELGHKQVPIFNLGYIDERRAKEIGVIDNTRYGIDDTIGFADLLKEIGNPEELQVFLPFGSADLEDIFASADIDLEDLSLDPEPEEEKPEEKEKPVEREAKTHTVMRFKVPLADAERITALIASTKKTHSYTHDDDLTNAGDALVHVLSPQLPKSGDALSQLEETLKEKPDA